MNEIDRILKDVSDHYAFTDDDLKIIKEAMVKAAFTAINYPNIAVSICSYVSKKEKEKNGV